MKIGQFVQFMINDVQLEGIQLSEIIWKVMKINQTTVELQAINIDLHQKNHSVGCKDLLERMEA